ncbi:MAG: hypothetical protein LH478_09095 [Chitinophagaceae bacterium]|nr:hypothetical protein [Chitinophagaceae bacterium]
MKVLLPVLISILSIHGASAQNYMPGIYLMSPYQNTFYNRFPAKDSSSKSKWSINKYGGIQTSFIGWKGGSATTFSVPIGLQLTRKLSDKVYAFAGVQAAPTFVNFNRAFMQSNFNNGKNGFNSFMYQPNGFGMYSRAELGLMYTNEERTFQISGSFGVERRQFPQFREFQSFEKKSAQ